MFADEKNLKDPERKSLTSYGAGTQDMSVILSYTKTNKLITALYMVTDIIDKDEPLRNKLRTLGTGIISDMYAYPASACSKISELMSFLDIASTVNIISEMNFNILRKEFMQLDRSIKESKEAIGSLDRELNLEEFFREEPAPLFDFLSPHPNPLLGKERGKVNSKGHQSIEHVNSTRIGVQKGSTLMQALSDKIITDVGRQNFGRPTSVGTSVGKKRAEEFLMLKKQRNNDIIDIIKVNGGSASITDIKNKIKAGSVNSFVSSSEKTLQRELVSMTKSGLLKKTGEKRWSRYSLVS